jgi:hypothetical protein
MSALIDPYDDPIERCSALCSEVCFELKQDVFAVTVSAQEIDQVEDTPFKTTVLSKYTRLKNSILTIRFRIFQLARITSCGRVLSLDSSNAAFVLSPYNSFVRAGRTRS